MDGRWSRWICSKPCANHAECGDPNLWRCAEVDAEYLCTWDQDTEPPTASWAGANAQRSLVGAGSLPLEIDAHDDRSLAEHVT